MEQTKTPRSRQEIMQPERLALIKMREVLKLDR